eukprot:SAG11_NODE_4505_length_1870_cov_35.487860_2_plen_147_part_00
MPKGVAGVSSNSVVGDASTPAITPSTPAEVFGVGPVAIIVTVMGHEIDGEVNKIFGPKVKFVSPEIEIDKVIDPLVESLVNDSNLDYQSHADAHVFLSTAHDAYEFDPCATRIDYVPIEDANRNGWHPLKAKELALSQRHFHEGAR